jgi:hypothetical protein
MELFVFWLIMGGVVAIIANSKGKSAFAWFVYGALIWPIALVHILVSSPDRQSVDRPALARGDMKKCPQCAELILSEPRKCRYCGSEV